MNRFAAYTFGLSMVVALVVVPGIGRAQVLIGPFIDFEDDLPGPIPASGAPQGLFRFHGPTVDDGIDPQFAVDFSHAILDTGGVGGSQAYQQNVDGTGPGLEGGPGFWFAGFGAFHQFGTTDVPLAGGVPGSDNPSRYRFSADIKVEGNEIPNPVIFSAWVNVGDYESRYNVDINDDGDLSDSADVYRVVNQPVLLDTTDFQTVSFTLDEGTISWTEGILPEHQGVFNNEASMLWAVNWGGAEFGHTAGNSLTIDNIRIEFFELTVPPGDFNEDGVVDAADYVWWRKFDGDPATYQEWRTNFGAGAVGSGSGSLTASSAVPEPGTLALIALAAALATVQRRIQTRRRQHAPH